MRATKSGSRYGEAEPVVWGQRYVGQGLERQSSSTATAEAGRLVSAMHDLQFPDPRKEHLRRSHCALSNLHQMQFILSCAGLEDASPRAALKSHLPSQDEPFRGERRLARKAETKLKIGLMPSCSLYVAFDWLGEIKSRAGRTPHLDGSCAAVLCCC